MLMKRGAGLIRRENASKLAHDHDETMSASIMEIIDCRYFKAATLSKMPLERILLLIDDDDILFAEQASSVEILVGVDHIQVIDGL